MTVQPLAQERFAGAREQLRAELSLLDLLLERHILRLRAAQLLNETDFRGLYISDEEVDAILRSAGAPRQDGANVATLTQRIDERRRDLTVRDSAPPLDFLQRRLSLDRFSIEMLVLAVATEVDLRYQTLFAYAQNDVTRKLPSIDLALQLLCDDADERIERRDEFGCDAPLIRERLIRVSDDAQDRDAPWLAHVVRADARIADYLLQRDAFDPRLALCARRTLPSTKLRDLRIDAGLLERVANVLPQAGREPCTVIVEGASGSGRKSVAEAMAAQLGLSLVTLDLAQLPAALPILDAIALVRREALLGADAVLLDHFERIAGDDFALSAQRTRIAQELLGLARPLFVITTESWMPEPAFRVAPVYDIAIGVPSFALRVRCWNDALGGDAAELDVDWVAGRFALTPAQIRDAAAHARALAASRAGPKRTLMTDDLTAGAQVQSSHNLRKLATPVELKQTWDDLVLPPRPAQQLRDVCASMRFRHVVYDRWGFARRLAGRGMSILFSGPSGTGKTLAASIIARALGLEMYKIDLSAVVSKYIGETEKNLSRIFTEAQTSNAILFFDEADALFGKRSEVKDAHDRYANIEIAFLLQRIEAHDGVVILATNLSRNIDEAFARRMFDTIEFPFPDAPHRERIWRGMLTGGAPVADDVDYAFLAHQFELAGGNIRNVVLAAAFSAAAADASITMRDLVRATSRELLKIGRLPSKSEFREYYDLIRESDVSRSQP